MVQTSFLASSTNTGAMPPSMHFFTQAAPEPACLAPHIESEIHPSILVESAALAAIAVKAKPATSRAITRFISASRNWEILINYHHAPRSEEHTSELQSLR